jgi:predicted nucleic acid-binding protein
MLTGAVAFAASPAVIIEYEDLLKRPGVHGEEPWLDGAQIDQLLDAICARAVSSLPWFRFRPFLNDPKDDLYVECALAVGARTIVTFDRHFRHPAVSAFGLEPVTPAELVSRSGLRRTH